MNKNQNTGRANANLWLLGWVSLLNDLSSQMIYPLIPGFLKSLGSSNVVIGLIEGIAEATAALFKTYFGGLSDQFKKRKPFILLGYALSTFSKPFLYLATAWWQVLAVKFSDRIGKSIRVPARDALLAASVKKEKRGSAFGIQRAMDKIGSLGGPLLAMLFLYIFQGNLRWLFLVSFVPAFFALFLIPLTTEKEETQQKSLREKKTIRINSPMFSGFLIASVVFSLGNSSNAFLLLKAGEAGIPLTYIPLLWAGYNLVCAVSSVIFGHWSDIVGKQIVLLISFLFYSLVYMGFAFFTSAFAVWVLFGLYGIHYGLSEGVGKAYIADIVPPEKTATAYGLYQTGVGLALLPASLLMGWIWDQMGSFWAFLLSAAFSFLGFLILLFLIRFFKPSADILHSEN